MNAPETLLEMDRSLRDLIARESFDDARTLLDAFSAAVESEIAAASGDPALLLEMSSRMADFFAWAEARTKAHRSCADAEIARLKSVGRYEVKPPSSCRFASA